jgi:sodium pump decarboxylase gamma subunit
MLNESILIMTVGMGSVFVFLGVLVVALQISARFFADWPLDEEPQPLSNKAIPNIEQDDDVLIAIALAAIQHQESQS